MMLLISQHWKQTVHACKMKCSLSQQLNSKTHTHTYSHTSYQVKPKLTGCATGNPRAVSLAKSSCQSGILSPTHTLIQTHTHTSTHSNVRVYNCMWLFICAFVCVNTSCAWHLRESGVVVHKGACCAACPHTHTHPQSRTHTHVHGALRANWHRLKRERERKKTFCIWHTFITLWYTSLYLHIPN